MAFAGGGRMTKFENIKAMTIEELAKYLLNLLCQHSNITRTEINEHLGTDIPLIDIDEFVNENYGVWVEALESEAKK